MSSATASAPAPDSSAAAATAAANAAKELNINAKPFVPTFGGPAAATTGGATTPSAPQQTKPNNNNNNKAPLPTPPMPYMMGGMNPYAAMGMGMGMGLPGGPPPMVPQHQMMYQQQHNASRYYNNHHPQMGGMGGMGVGMNPQHFAQMQQQQMNPYAPPNPMYGAGFGVHHSNNNTPTMMNAHMPPNQMMMMRGGAGTPSHPNNATGLPRAVNNTAISGGAATSAGNSPATAAQQGPKKPVTFPRKVAFLVLGGRGSGKSTQCARLAKQFNLLHIAGGSFAADKKLPLIELVHVLRENFVEDVEVGKAQSISNSNVSENEANGGAADQSSSPTATSSPAATETKKPEYNGVVLDRMIALHEYDAYYLDYILRKFGMAVELVFLLMLDSEIAIQRAVMRGDGKPVDHTRQMAEHRIQYAAVNSVYSPLKILHCVECDGMPIDAISRALERVVENTYANPSGNTAALPPVPQIPHHPYTQGKCRLVTDYEKFYSLRNQMLVAVHDSQKPPTVCPASLMSGIADRRMFTSPKQARPLVNSFATLKADGQRVLLFKHHKDGAVYGINGIFHFIYNFSPYFEDQGITLPTTPEEYLNKMPEHGIEWVLDAECYAVEGRTQIAVFDYLYLYGQRGNAQLFETRLDNLTKFFERASIAETNTTGTKVLYGPSPFFLKQYVPSTKVRDLLPDPSKPPFPIDGVVFQHFGGYKFGRDNAIYKWKPREKCTVDFRLDKANEPMKQGGEWTFVPMVGDDKEEVPWPNAQVRATDPDARRCDLCDGTIAECIKRESSTSNNNPNVFVIWDFVRIRPEKPTPNRLEIAKTVDSMEHMTFDELARALEALKK